MAYKQYYRLVHAITGYTIGRFNSYDAAECVRNSMDDWVYWSVEPFTD